MLWSHGVLLALNGSEHHDFQLPSKVTSVRSSLMSGNLFTRVEFWILIEMDSNVEYNFTSQWSSPKDVFLFFYPNYFFHIVFMYSQTFHLALIFSLVESFNSVHLAQNPYFRDEYSWDNFMKGRHAVKCKLGWHCWPLLILL